MLQELRESLDSLIKEALGDQELTMKELVNKIDKSIFSVRDIKTRVLNLIPEKIELTRNLELKIK